MHGSQKLPGIHVHWRPGRWVRQQERADEVVQIPLGRIHPRIPRTDEFPFRGDAAFVQFPHVLLKIEVPAETFAAHAACERLLVVVRVHVEGQVVDLVEGLAAHRAFVGLFPAVRKLVVLVVALLMEPFAAVFAHERLVSVIKRESANLSVWSEISNSATSSLQVLEESFYSHRL